LARRNDRSQQIVISSFAIRYKIVVAVVVVVVVVIINIVVVIVAAEK
jgi:hypothetical protein